MAELKSALPAQPPSYAEPTFDEKEPVLDLAKSSYDYKDANERPLNVNGEPVITNGIDVSKHLVDPRDDEDPPFTFRSVVLGTVIGGLGAALYQVCCPLPDDLDPDLRTFACRYTSSSLSKKGSRQCFYSS
jgi:hypothetical protein